MKFHEAAFAEATVCVLTVKVRSVVICTLKPVSLFELSSQLSVRVVCVTLAVVMFDGAAGMVAAKVACARAVDQADVPTKLYAATRK